MWVHFQVVRLAQALRRVYLVQVRVRHFQILHYLIHRHQAQPVRVHQALAPVHQALALVQQVLAHRQNHFHPVQPAQAPAQQAPVQLQVQVRRQVQVQVRRVAQV